MLKNWIRNNEGKYFNLDKISKIFVDERKISGEIFYYICADTFDIENACFFEKNDAQNYLDSMMEILSQD